MSSEKIGSIAAGGLAYVDDRLDEARVAVERAFRELRDAGQPAAAARVATLLGELHWGGLGNPPSAAAGWNAPTACSSRAGPCVEWGYWELGRLGVRPPRRR